MGGPLNLGSLIGSKRADSVILSRAYCKEVKLFIEFWFLVIILDLTVGFISIIGVKDCICCIGRKLRVKVIRASRNDFMEKLYDDVDAAARCSKGCLR